MLICLFALILTMRFTESSPYIEFKNTKKLYEIKSKLIVQGLRLTFQTTFPFKNQFQILHSISIFFLKIEAKGGIQNGTT